MTYIMTAQWWRGSRVAGPFTLHSAVLEPQCKKKMHLSMNLSRAESVQEGARFPVQPRCVHSVGFEG